MVVVSAVPLHGTRMILCPRAVCTVVAILSLSWCCWSTRGTSVIFLLAGVIICQPVLVVRKHNDPCCLVKAETMRKGAVRMRRRSSRGSWSAFSPGICGTDVGGWRVGEDCRSSGELSRVWSGHADPAAEREHHRVVGVGLVTKWRASFDIVRKSLPLFDGQPWLGKDSSQRGVPVTSFPGARELSDQNRFDAEPAYLSTPLYQFVIGG